MNTHAFLDSRRWFFSITAAVITIGAAVLLGQARETARVERLLKTLADSAARPVAGRVDFTSFAGLPAPVARYFRHVLTDGQRLIRVVRMQQSGVLRTAADSDSWSPFTASQIVAPRATAFLWNARVEMPLAAHVRVLDSYISGKGAGRVSLLSCFTVAAHAGTPELDSGALHRYLAEAVWYPTALLPQSGVAWRPVSDRAALATLSDHGVSVSLEFRFGTADEVTGIYSAGRYGRFDGKYRKVPWQGHFRDYQLQDGMLVPRYGEVGWYDGAALQLVWQGQVNDVRYEFEP